MKTQEEYAREIDEIVLRDVENHQTDWFDTDKKIFMLPCDILPSLKHFIFQLE